MLKSALDTSVLREIPIEQVDTYGCLACLEYWIKACGGQFAPSWKAFELVRLPPNVVPMIAVVDVQLDPLDFIYRYWGTGHVHMKNEECTGKKVSELLPAERSEINYLENQLVFEKAQPKAFTHNRRTMDSSVPLAHLTLRLPLSDDGEVVDKIVSYSSFEKSALKWVE